MGRTAFIMKLKPGFEDVYRNRHNQIWPELTSALSKAGISDYGIYLNSETNMLFAVYTTTDNFDPTAIPKLSIVKKWWKMMSDIMEVNADNSPITIPMQEVFYMK